MKNFKTFYETQRATRLKETIQSPPLSPHQIKASYVSGTKNCSYGNIQTFAFQVLRECSSWASRNCVVQMLL